MREERSVSERCPVAGGSVQPAPKASLGRLEWIGIDTETGGLRPECDALLEVAAHNRKWHFSILVRPQAALRVGPEAARVNGITREHALAAGVDEGAVLELLGIMATRFDATRPAVLIGQHIAFDLGFLHAAMERQAPHLRDKPSWGAVLVTMGLAWVDTGLVGRCLFPDEDLSLGRLAQRLRVPVVGTPHRAGTDARTALAVWEAERRLLRARGVTSWGDLAKLRAEPSRRYA